MFLNSGVLFDLTIEFVALSGLPSPICGVNPRVWCSHRIKSTFSNVVWTLELGAYSESTVPSQMWRKP